jgi:branched-chain amino acid transport system permease protein
MSEFFSFAVGGLPFGCTVALVAVGLVLTYRVTGVFHFAFGAQAYAAGVTYVTLTGNDVPGTGWPPLAAAAFIVFVVAPLFGALLDWGLFSRIPRANVTAKIVTSLGLMAFLPNVVQMVVGPITVNSAPAPFLAHYTVLLAGVLVTGPEIATAVTTGVVLVTLMALFRFGPFGVRFRAAIESPKLLELQGVRSRRVVRVSWMTSTALAALAGVLFVPMYATQSAESYGVLLVAAVAGAALGGLASLPLAVVGGVLLGLLEGIVPGYLSPDTVWYTALVPSLPFFLLLVLLVAHPRFRRGVEVGDPLSAVEPPPPAPALALRPATVDQTVRSLRWPVLIVGVVAVLLFVPELWVGTLSLGAATAVIFLSVTLLTGLAGQLSLAQVVFAGIGGCATAQLSTNAHVPVLAAMVLGALIAGVGGWVASLPALRRRGLPIALLTLCFSLLADNLLFPTSFIGGGPAGLSVARPVLGGVNFAGVGSRSFFALCVLVLLAVAAVVHIFLRGSTGRALSAVHASEVAAAAVGVPARRLTVGIFMLSAFVAGLGGALFAVALGTVNVADFNAGFGPVYLVVVVTVGAATVEGAVIAGFVYAALPQVLALLPQRVGGGSQGTALTIVLLSVGAFTYARHPEGLVEYGRRSVLRLIHRREPDVATPFEGVAP